MIALVSRLVANAIGTVIGREVKRVLRAAALGIAAGAFAIAMIVFLFVTAYAWLGTLLPPVERDLAMAGGFLVLMLVCVLLLTLSGRRPRPVAAAVEIAPLVELLKAAGCEKEAAALAAGTQVANQLRPYYLLVVAVVVGLVLGRKLGRPAPSEKSPTT